MSHKKFFMGRKVLLSFLVVAFLFSSQAVLANPGGQATHKIVCKYWLSFHGGFTKTNLDFVKKAINFNIIVNFEIRCWVYWAIVFEAGYNAFKWDMEDLVPDVKFHWWNFNPTIRLFMGKDKFKPFLSFGPGLYVPKDGDARFGGKLGVGFDYQITDRLMFEMGADYHHVFLKEADFVWEKNFHFFHGHVGLVFRL